MTAHNSLRLGELYPYDAPKSWWDSDSTVRPKLQGDGDWSFRAARGVIEDLCDRRGIKNGFEDIPDDIRVDIVAALAEIIREAEKAK